MGDDMEMLAHAESIARTLELCSPLMETQRIRECFAELGRRFSDLVTIGKEPGGAEIVADPIRNAIREAEQVLDGLIRMPEH
ncbi:MAG: hypothetical protein VB144_03635 [Clostridia bacterium]|nr:hypothetical protein [Clostridia bacterium]